MGLEKVIIPSYVHFLIFLKAQYVICMHVIMRDQIYINLYTSLADEMPSEATPVLYGHSQRDSSLNTDLPTIPLIVIQKSTHHFSEASKLGEGGFGPVYKV